MDTKDRYTVVGTDRYGKSHILEKHLTKDSADKRAADLGALVSSLRPQILIEYYRDDTTGTLDSRELKTIDVVKDKASRL